MALINPVHGLVVPFLFIFTLPLAIFAGITSALAFSVLMFRVAIVYLDIALAFVPQYFLRGKSKSSFLSSADKQRRYSRGDGWKTPVSPTPSTRSNSSGHSTPSPFPQATGYPGSGYVSPGSARRRKSSYGFNGALNGRRPARRSSSQVSVCTATPIHEDEVSNEIAALTPAAFADAGLTPSVGLDRDYEGIGGWRLDDDGDDSDWTNINSRLELPHEGRSSFPRSHSRSQSAGPINPVEPYLVPRAAGSRRETMNDTKPEWFEKSASTGGGSGTKAAGPSPSSSRVRLNQTIPMPSAFTTLDGDNGDMLSPRSFKKTPPA